MIKRQEGKTGEQEAEERSGNHMARVGGKDIKRLEGRAGDTGAKERSGDHAAGGEAR